MKEEFLIASTTTSGFKYLHILGDFKTDEWLYHWSNTVTLEKIPNQIVSEDVLYSFGCTQRKAKDILDAFFPSLVVQDTTLYAHLLNFTDLNGRIHAGQYTIYTDKEPIIVNYKPGGNEQFKNLYDALYWITNIHYPAQVSKTLHKLLKIV